MTAQDLKVIAVRLRSQAAISDRPGQLEQLEALADEVEAIARGVEEKPLGYLVLSKTEDRLISGAYRYTAACPITESILPAEQFAAQVAKRRKRYVIAELREVPDAG